MLLPPFGPYLSVAIVLMAVVCLLLTVPTVYSLMTLTAQLQQEQLDRLTFQQGTATNCTLFSKDLTNGVDCLNRPNATCDLWWSAQYLAVTATEPQSQMVWFNTAATSSTNETDHNHGLDLRPYSIGQTITCYTISPSDPTARRVLWSPTKHNPATMALIIISTILLVIVIMAYSLLIALLWQYCRQPKIINLDNQLIQPLLDSTATVTEV